MRPTDYGRGEGRRRMPRRTHDDFLTRMAPYMPYWYWRYRSPIWMVILSGSAGLIALWFTNTFLLGI